MDCQAITLGEHLFEVRYAHAVIRCSPDTASRLPFRYLKHTSKLIRKLGNSDLALQHNKVINLKLTVASMDGGVIGHGEYFCKLGYVEGMELSFGEARSGIGGGICQLSNLIHRMAIHSPLVVVNGRTTASIPFLTKGGYCHSAPGLRSFTTTLTWCCITRLIVIFN